MLKNVFGKYVTCISEILYLAILTPTSLYIKVYFHKKSIILRSTSMFNQRPAVFLNCCANCGIPHNEKMTKTTFDKLHVVLKNVENESLFASTDPSL